MKKDWIEEVRKTWHKSVTKPIKINDLTGSSEYMVTYRDASVDFKTAFLAAVKEDVAADAGLREFIVKSRKYFTMLDALEYISNETFAKHGLIIEPFEMDQVYDEHLVDEEFQELLNKDELEREE